MNAIIALCHFCEAHGPCSIFCTQTLRDTRLNDVHFNSDNINKNCPACNSIGNSLALLSKDTESFTTFLSTQIPVINDVVSLVRQAAVRSLSCEVSSNKDGGFVFFGDASRGHVLSHTFQIRDSQARGFYRLFSIIIIMKDKMFLLNIQPFLSEHLQKISKELQNYSAGIYNGEQSQSSERAQRLKKGYATIQVPRSLIELTGEEHIFAQIHSHFSWLLWSGARYLTESVTIGSPAAPPWLGRDTEEGFALVKVDKEEWLMNKLGFDELDDDIDIISMLRRYRDILRSDFISVCYCAIIGTQIVLRGSTNKTIVMLKGIKKFLPKSLHRLTRILVKKYLPPSECRILTILPEVAVPQPCNGILRIDFFDNESMSVKWLGEVPTKWPDLLTKIMKAFDEKLFTDVILEKQLKVLVEEWKNKILCMKKIQSSSELNKIKKILGVQQHDALLVNYWTNYL